jgi:hypothetical protein
MISVKNIIMQDCSLFLINGRQCVSGFHTQNISMVLAALFISPVDL